MNSGKISSGASGFDTFQNKDDAIVSAVRNQPMPFKCCKQGRIRQIGPYRTGHCDPSLFIPRSSIEKGSS